MKVINTVYYLVGTDEAAIIKVFANRSAVQRKAIASKYLAAYGKVNDRFTLINN